MSLTGRFCLPAACLAALAAWAVALPAGQVLAADPPQTQPDMKAAATVNGEPILESELSAALPTDALLDTVDDARRAKLNRLISTQLREQFLREHKVEVPESKVEEGFRKFEIMVRTPGCPCCGGGFANIEQYMKVYWYTMPELRRQIRNDAGFVIYFDRLVADAFTPEVIKERRPVVEKGFVKGSVMFFDFWADPHYNKNPKASEANTEKAALAAWERLKKGEAFDAVAKSVQGDSYIETSGGSARCYQASLMEEEMRGPWLKLAPGEISPPVRTPDGFNIIKRDTLAEQDVTRLIQDQIKREAQERIQQEYTAFRAKAKIDYTNKAAAPTAAGQSSLTPASPGRTVTLIPPLDPTSGGRSDRQPPPGRESGL